jgi:hypothetical protein
LKEVIRRKFCSKLIPSFGGQKVIFNVFVANFPNQPSQYDKAIKAFRFELWETIGLPVEVLFRKL